RVEQGRVKTTFNVQGPTDVKVTADDPHVFDPKTPTQCKPGDPIEVGKLQFFTDTDKHGKVVQEVGLGLGNKKSVGILFKACATMPSGGSGQFIWVQLIIRDDI